MRSFMRLWFLGIIRPQKAITILLGKPAPIWGFLSILVRFVGTALTSILALALLERQPFVQPYITFLDPTNYYKAEIFFLPLFGIAAWLLSGAFVHLVLRLTGANSEFGRILNLIGYSLLVVMPFVWLVDWTSIALDLYGASITIPVHAAISLWEVGLMALGFWSISGVNRGAAVALGILVKGGVFIPLAAVFVR